MRLHRAALLRIALSAAAGTVLAVLTLPLLGPMESNALGLTFCYPILGPVQRFNPDVTASQLSRTQAHEAAHAAQCKRDGSVWHLMRRLAPSQRLQSESEASCAEVRFAATEGAPARLEYARVLDELRDEAWFHRFSADELADALASQCPDLAARAARQEAEWRARRAHHRPL